jgi:cephalosporin hydroxylase
MQFLRVAVGVLRDGPTPLLVARRAISQFDAIQRTWELQSLVALVRRMKPMTVVEIGSYKGGTLACWAAVAHPSAQIVGIDMPYPWADKEAIASSIDKVRTVVQPSQRLTVIAADSHDATTLAALKETLAGVPIDVLWIDGDHTYEGVRQDVQMYGDLVRAGGIIALHDIRQSDQFPDQQSDVYWQELRAHARTREFIAEPTPGAGMGIGVIFVD